MATSKTFFGLRRGSTKSLTFQIVNGVQVTKERVQHVANPKTKAQIMQRMKLAPAQRVARALASLIDHSFEGVAYGSASKNHFLKLAMLRADGPYMQKGESDFPLSAYCISVGSLPEIRETDQFTGLSATTTWGEISKKLADSFALKDGDHLTSVEVKDNVVSIREAILNFASTEKLSAIDFGALSGTTWNTVGTVDAWAVIVSRLENGTWKRSTAFFHGELKHDDPVLLADAINSYNVEKSVKSFGSDKILNKSEDDARGLIKKVRMGSNAFLIGLRQQSDKVVTGVFTSDGTKDGFLINHDRTVSKTKLSTLTDVMKKYSRIFAWNSNASSASPGSGHGGGSVEP